MKTIYIIILTVLVYANILGQTPGQFKYQAVLRDASGNLLINQAKTLVVDILQGSASGTSVFTESHSTTTNAQGLINLNIGSVNTTGLSTINWATGPYFIKITVDGVIFTASQLLSVPYAKYAEKAGNGFSGSYSDLTNKPDFTKWDKDSTDNVILTGNQTIAGTKTFSGTVKADSLSLTKKTTKWVFDSHYCEGVTSGLTVIKDASVSYVTCEASSTGNKLVYLYLPQLPYQILGNVQRIKSITIRYQCISTQAYINSIELVKVCAGSVPTIGESTETLTNTSAANYTITLPTASDFTDCALHVKFTLTFNNTGSANAIRIYRVFLTAE